MPVSALPRFQLFRRLRFLRLPMTLTGVGLVLGACASHAPQPVDEARVSQFAAHGYLSEGRYATEDSDGEWTRGDRVVPLSWTLPASGSHLPVVVYLPGLGEPATAGQAWRSAWAHAGYAVLSVQLLDEDSRPLAPTPRAPGEAAPTDPRALQLEHAAQLDEMRTQAREHYRPELARQRLEVLAALLGDLRAGRLGGAGAQSRVDAAHVALAGFDIGAYTALLAIGEQPREDWLPAAMPVDAVIALSPYADFSGRAFAERYRAIRVPVLSVSGDGDSDPLGLVPSTYVRRAPFENLSATGTALLWLGHASHHLFAGARSPAPAMRHPPVIAAATARSLANDVVPAQGDRQAMAGAAVRRLVRRRAVRAAVWRAQRIACLRPEYGP